MARPTKHNQKQNSRSKEPSKQLDLTREVLRYIASQENHTFNYRQVSFALGLNSPAAQKSVAMLLAEMAFDGDLIEVSPGKYKAPQRSNVVMATFVRRSNGKNSIITDPDGESIFVAERNSMHALNGDRVKAIVAAVRRGVEPEAEVIEIIEPKEQTFIGTIHVNKQYSYLQTDSKFLAVDIIIPRAKLHGGETGDKAVVKIIDWPDESKNPIGQVVDILGKADENHAEMHAILAEFGLPYRYPEN
ncbi:MAG: ribonuclease R, partial [Paramuribaculum sp.]|nr:ribonuclease R [Paramuribaculum sp.]